MENKMNNTNTVKNIIKKLDNFLVGIANNVKCVICQDLFIGAVTNKCGHSFCMKCIQKMNCTSKYGRVNCPLCRYPIKKRSGVNNAVLSKIAKLFWEAPDAFQKDVLALTINFKDIQRELIECSKIWAFREEKFKDENTTKKELEKKKNIKWTNSQMSQIKVLSVESSDIGSNIENMDFKSVSQAEMKSSPHLVVDVTDVKKGPNCAAQIAGKEKINNWLENVNADMSTESIFSTFASKEKLIEEQKDTGFANSTTSMIRRDYYKSKKLNEVTLEGSVKGNLDSYTSEQDPYEFIPSQGNPLSKRKKIGRKRKKHAPKFENVQCFSAEKLCNGHLKDNTGVFDDYDSSSVRVKKPNRTYGRTSGRNKPIRESKKNFKSHEGVECRETSTYDTRSSSKQLFSNIEDSFQSECYESDADLLIKNKEYDRRGTISSDADCLEYTSAKVLKKPKLDNNEELREESDCRKNLQSPGWSRVTDLKMIFRTAAKGSRPCRKTLDISGGEINLHATRRKSNESNEKLHIITDKSLDMELSQKDVEFDGQTEMKKSNEFSKIKKVCVTPEIKCDAIENTCGETYDGAKSDSKIVTNDTKNKVQTSKKGSESRILFSLLGRIKKRKKISIAFLKMGRLSPHVVNSSKETVKFKVAAADAHRGIAKIQTNKSVMESQIEFREDATSLIEAKVDVAVQTEQDISAFEKIRTFQSNDCLSIGTQANTHLLKEWFEESATSREKLKIDQQNMKAEVNRLQSVECGLNQTGEVTREEVVENVSQISREDRINSENEGKELIQRVMYNINLDVGNVNVVDTPVASQNESAYQAEENYDESDSDIFIEQTPPRENVLVKTEDSFLLLSQVQKDIPASGKSELEIIQIYENNRNQLNNKDQDSVHEVSNLCIVSSGIRNRKMLENFVKKFKMEHSNFPKKEMTHLVVGLHENEDDELVPYCTPKFLYAMANKKWIVTELWIDKCLKLNKIVSEEPFESVDPTGGNGCYLARQSTNLLLENCEIHLYGPFITIPKQEFEELIKDCGGSVIQQLKDFSYSEKKIRMILLDTSSPHDNHNYEALSRTYSTLVMSSYAAIMSIQSYQLVNFAPFVQHKFSTEECITWGYPLQLVQKEVNLDDSCSDNATR